VRAEILGIGARSAVGLTALQTAFGLRSRRFAPGASPFLDATERAIGVVRLRALPDDVDGFDRLVALAAPALKEATAGVASPVTLILAAPEPHEGFLATEGRSLAEALAETSGVALDAERSVVFASGSAGMAVAVSRALDELARQPSRPIVVGGLDTFFDGARLEALDREQRILSHRAPSGLLPGEAAGFLVLGPPRSDATCGVVAALAGAEVAAGTDEPVLAEALTELVEQGESQLAGAGPPWIIVDDLLERHRSREWSFVLARRGAWSGDEPSVVDDLAAHAGSLGAGAGAIAMIWVAVGMQAGFAPSRSALVVLASDGPARGVVALRGAARGS
jgi:3-oxoacyl-[acyl-carrier-protein] synthase-1